MLPVTTSRTSISGCSLLNLAMRQISQREAKTLPTVSVSTFSLPALRLPTASASAANPLDSCGRIWRSTAVGFSPCGVRSNSSSPSRSSARRRCWLTAPGVTPSSSAAGPSAPRRATISMARMALSGMGNGLAMEIFYTPDKILSIGASSSEAHINVTP